MQSTMCCLAALLLVVSPVTALNVEASLTSSLTFDVDAAKARPVSKVIALLKDMLKELEKEADEDEEIYDKIACWCETNDKEKTAAIKAAEAKIADLESKIAQYTAKSAQLGTEIKGLEKEMAANQAALDQATSIREKQLAEFNAEEKDLLESISALKAAIVVLSKHHSSLLQIPRSHLMGVVASVQREMQKHANILAGVLTHSERKAMSAFLQAPQDYFDSTPTFKQAYAPQSGDIFGILSQMKETFESNLSESSKEEMANSKAYEELKAAKEAQIAANADQISKKTMELANTDEKNAQAKQDIEDTKASLSADEQFLMMLKEKCSLTDKEWEDRQKTRQMEMKAVSEALSILSSDDAHDLFTKTFNPTLLQESSMNTERRAEASKLLSRVAQKLHSSQLASLAVSVRLDVFTQVKKAIDDMIAQLLVEKADEIKHKDFCVGELNQNQLDTEKYSRDKEDLVAKLADLELTIKTLGEDITNLNSQIGELQVQLKRAGEDREKQNKEFQDTIADQRATQKLLAQALTILKGFYDTKATSLLQRQQKQEPAGPPPPPGFQAYEKNAASGGVLSLIQQIISDAKAMEAEAIHDEDAAQKAYEDYVKDTNASIDSKSKEIVHKSKAKAKAEGDQVEAMDSKEAVELQLTQLANSNADTRKSCDFVLNNFDIRQTARDEEIEALKQAKAILSGAKFTELLQTLA
mmetsp:Transcript_157945/g.274206  ORF Transcript_157945/g.274206 Transcript_157945/m.274206 type:complete len:700 (+) Transcript_157945:62-2161(+)